MTFEKISKNKIKIVFYEDELIENNISIHSFLCDSVQSQELFKALLDIADEELGFKTLDYKVLSETFSISNKKFIIFITRIEEANTFLFTDIEKITPSLVLKKEPQKLVYKFLVFDELILFSKFFRKLFEDNSLQSSLFKIDSNYYLVVNFELLNIKNFKNMASIFSEFKENLNISNLGIIKIEECAELLIANNAIQKISLTGLI